MKARSLPHGAQISPRLSVPSDGADKREADDKHTNSGTIGAEESDITPQTPSQSRNISISNGRKTNSAQTRSEST